ncbi:hypothetical protein COTS27_00739 [Spirochaetota bacterium]|nr:hypothetical protein COTS27_00739 [Spirochaetota bacterium]
MILGLGKANRNNLEVVAIEDDILLEQGEGVWLDALDDWDEGTIIEEVYDLTATQANPETTSTIRKTESVTLEIR